MTQWNISEIPYDNDSSAYEGSYMEMWLNDATVDGFLGNLRNPDKFIKMDSKWNASQMTDTSKPPSESEGGTIVTQAVGLLNIYEVTMIKQNLETSVTYLHNGLYWWTLTPVDSITIFSLNDGTVNERTNVRVTSGVRPSINLKPEIKIVEGDGTKDNPYRLMGDNDNNLKGTKLNTRYSGEYISFGTGENNLYRIVSHETEGLTKIVSDKALKSNNTFIKMLFNDTYVDYSINTTIGSFLNGEYLDGGEYLTSEQVNMIEDNTTWYLGVVVSDGGNYRHAKYTDINMNSLTSKIANTKIGLLRYGELMSGQFIDRFSNNAMSYWLITRYGNTGNAYYVGSRGGLASYENQWATGVGVKPVFNLKENVIITSGDGTLQNPFTLSGN